MVKNRVAYSADIKNKAVEMKLQGYSTKQVMQELNIKNKTQVETWFRWYKNGETHRFHQQVGKQYSYEKGMAKLSEIDQLKLELRRKEVELEILKKYSKKKQIYIVTQFNHPNEVTEESKKAIKMLQKIGIVVKNQTVLLKGVNDDSHVLGSLLKKLTSIGVVPYYIFQCRPVKGVKGQFQVPFERGYEIIEGAKAMQNGQGKCFKYCFSCESGKIEVVGKLGDEMIFKFHEAKYEKDYGRIFTKKLEKDTCWLYDID